MANPGPNVISESLLRGAAVLKIANTPATVSTVIKASTVTEVAFTVTGVAVGDWVSCSPMSALPAGVTMTYARVSAANTVQVAFAKVTASDTQDSAGYYLFKVERPYPTAANTTDFGSTKPTNTGPVPLSA